MININQLIQDNLTQVSRLVSVKNQMHRDPLEQKLAEAIDLLRATIELQEKRAAGYYVLGHTHTRSNGGQEVSNFERQWAGCPPIPAVGGNVVAQVHDEVHLTLSGGDYPPANGEPTNADPVFKFAEWPKDWPPYFHRNEPCDMLVGPCSCGAWHTPGEFTLEQDGLRDPYVARNLREWPVEHTGGGGYSSQCYCSACSDLRASAQRRTDYQRSNRGRNNKV